MAEVPESYRDLLDRPILVSLATVQPDGQPQVTPIWADLHNGRVRFSTVVERQKHKNLRERPQATVLVVDPDQPLRYVEIRGTVARMSEADGDAVIDKLAHDYLGVEVYPYRAPGEARMAMEIVPTRVTASG